MPNDDALSAQAVKRLQTEKIIWMATVRPGGRPHLVPVWFVLVEGRIYACIDPDSVKGRNLKENPNISVALEEGKHPLICEGQTGFPPKPWPAAVVGAFLSKYEWDISTDDRYSALIEVTPVKWMSW
ncbi:MAG: pyridoxamine 5'-phosphate oxidase [Acidobacteria bacterium]|nr:MAG: pyridoxamine 5'-phosphate oxidase [Acidobacteriota bacterium]